MRKIDREQLVYEIVDYEHDTGRFFYRPLTSEGLTSAGFSLADVDHIAAMNKHVGEISVGVASRGTYTQISFTMLGVKVRMHAGAAAWLILTGEYPEGVIVFRDGDTSNLISSNIIHASKPAAKLLQGEIEGLQEDLDDEAEIIYRTTLRWYDNEGIRRSTHTAWTRDLNQVRLDRKALLESCGLWYARTLLTVASE